MLYNQHVGQKLMATKNKVISKQIYFIITRKCNYKCSFCIRNNLKEQNVDMSLENAKTILWNIHKYAPKSVIVITGGEPLFHPECENFIRHALSLYDHVILTTNGSFNEEKAEMLIPYLKNNLWLQFSLDGPRNVHDEIRGKGAYDKVIKNLTLLEEVSSHLLISSTIGSNNYKNISELAIALNSYKFSRWKLTMEIVKDPLCDMPLDISIWNSMIDEVLPLCYFNVRAQKYYDFDLMERFLISQEQHPVELITNCGSGKNTFVINPDFSVVPCTCMNEIIGNFITDNTEILLSKLENHCQLDPDEESICFSCKYKAICKGGCPGYSKKCFGKFNMGDLRCPLVKESMNV